jgi:Fe-S cluster assembly protein SufD
MSTTTVILDKTNLLQDFDMFSELYGMHTAEFNDLRKLAAHQFNLLNIPTTKHEEWKYFNLNSLTKENYKTFSHTNEQKLKSSDISSLNLVGKDACTFVLENGIFNSNASSIPALPKGIMIGALNEFKSEPRVLSNLGKHAAIDNQAMVALNTAFSFDGIVVLVDDNIKCELPIHLMNVTTSNDELTATYIRVLVVLGKNAEVNITEGYYTLNNNSKTFVNSVTEVVVGEGANLNYSKIQNEDQSTLHVNFHQIVQAKNSTVHTTTITLGGGMVRNNLHIKLDDINCNSYLNGLYVADGKQIIDNHTLVDHAKPNCFSSELYKGIIDDNAQGVFNGKILVREDAQKTNAYQSNKNILLSNDATMYAKPQLEIFADDVKCSHGATTGQIDDEALFYLRSRGIGEVEARKLLNHAFAADVINQIALEPLKVGLLGIISNKLSK